MTRLWLVSGVVLVAACGPEIAPPVAQRGSALEQTFAAAAQAYQVPVGVLEALAYVETRVSTAPLESASGGFGTMQLSGRADWNTLAQGARLTGVPEAQLKVDAQANIFAAAAVLRSLFDATLASEPSLQATQPGDWYRAVALYSGASEPSAGNESATEIFLQLERGFDPGLGNGVRLAPLATGWRAHAPAQSARRDALGDYPAEAAYAQSPNYTAGRASYQYVVIHTMQGSYAGTKSWFLSTASQVSAHYIVRSSDGQITQMVSDADTAWHAQCYNSKAIGIEHEGYIDAPSTWYTDAMYTESAKLTRYLADRHSIPIDRSHIIGHGDIPASCNTNGHTDPGTGWNWTRYMGLVGGGTSPTTGTLIGVIYTGGNSANREAGASVSVNGQTAVTGADGTFQFTLPAGTYTATVTKSGFGPASESRTITANTQTWGSMEINPSTGTGNLTGVVYAGTLSAPLAGATVTANGLSVKTDASGAYTFTLPPGAYVVTASLTGYRGNQQTFTVQATGATTGNLALTAAGVADTQAPSIAITSLTDGSSSDVGVVDLKGTAWDDSGAPASVSLTLDGTPAVSLPVTAGAFSTQVALAPGANTLVVSATDAAGNVGSAQVSVSFKAGISGVVSVAGDAAHGLAGASVQLREGSSGAVVAQVATDAAGAFFAAAPRVPADYVLVVHLTGYLTASQTLTAPVDHQLKVAIPLTAGTDPVGNLALSFTQPLDGSTVNTGTVVVQGSAEGFELASVSIDGIEGQLIGDGSFSVTVPVALGSNTLTALAQGLRGEAVSGHLTIARVGPGGITAKGGCSSASGLEWFFSLALLPLLRRRR